MSSNESFRLMAHAGCALTICNCRDGRERFRAYFIYVLHFCETVEKRLRDISALRKYSFDRIHSRDLHHILQACP